MTRRGHCCGRVCPGLHKTWICQHPVDNYCVRSLCMSALLSYPDALCVLCIFVWIRLWVAVVTTAFCSGKKTVLDRVEHVMFEKSQLSSSLLLRRIYVPAFPAFLYRMYFFVFLQGVCLLPQSLLWAGRFFGVQVL